MLRDQSPSKNARSLAPEGLRSGLGSLRARHIPQHHHRQARLERHRDRVRVAPANGAVAQGQEPLQRHMTLQHEAIRRVGKRHMTRLLRDAYNKRVVRSFVGIEI